MARAGLKAKQFKSESSANHGKKEQANETNHWIEDKQLERAKRIKSKQRKQAKEQSKPPDRVKPTSKANESE